MHTIKTLLCALGLAGLTSISSLAAPVETPGFLKFEYYRGMDAGLDLTAVADLISWTGYPNAPDMTSYTSALDSRPVFPNDNHEHYGARMTGWLVPLETADYYFFLKSDDASELWLSSDATEANLALIADQIGCCNAFTEPNPDNPVFYTTQTPLHLVAGQKYAVQLLLKEGAGGDYAQVAWRKAGDTAPAATLPPIPGTYSG